MTVHVFKAPEPIGMIFSYRLLQRRFVLNTC